jgi:predicted glycoside hydrolase/deacetylase ChbG (UPF0249 family)
MAHAINVASFHALDRGAITSASVMVVCPWFSEVARFYLSHPRFDLGIHLTLTSEWDDYKWSPLLGKDSVPSLVGPDGYMWKDTASLRKFARPEEVERELRAQIRKALDAGIRPTHLDSHMFGLWRSPELTAVFERVGADYVLPVLSPRTWCLHKGDVAAVAPGTQRRVWLLDENTNHEGWTDAYVSLVGRLGTGIHQLIVHPGRDDAELAAIMGPRGAWGAAWRQRDAAVLQDPQFYDALRDARVELTTWKEDGAMSVAPSIPTCGTESSGA